MAPRPDGRSASFIVCGYGLNGNGIEAVVEFDLLRQRELASTAGITVQTETAAIIRTPLTERAIGTGMFFRSLFIHE